MNDAPSAGPELRIDPDWLGAAQLLVDGCAYLPAMQARVQLLERLCAALGPALYPALIGVLCTIGDQGSDAAMAAVADTLVEAMRTGRLPGGRRAAWGGHWRTWRRRQAHAAWVPWNICAHGGPSRRCVRHRR